MTAPDSRPQPELSAGTPLSQRLAAKYGSGVEPTLSLDVEPEPDSPASSKLFQKLQNQAPRGTRYRLLGEVARGGMGAILKIWDDELRRTLAMKVVLGGEESAGSAPQSVEPRLLERFLEEAQVTGQLDHPGIVPVHELGLGAEGRVYFTMRLVKGEDLGRVFQRVRNGEEGWTQVRALGVILKVCEAMSYAHSKKVIHRDLKPANVMVGKFGEVYVMDWGLARVLGRADKHDLRLQAEPTTSSSSVKTDRREERDTPDSPLVTMDGDIVGTPSFMPPEQAKGQLEKLGPHSDVYSVGAMLYALLAGGLPYVPRDARLSARTVLISVLNGPPRPLFELAPQAPAELIAIVEKAMARDIDERYDSMQALGDDLRAYIEGRVVRAHETGAWAEARKWVQRNRSLAATLGAAVLLLAGGLTVSLIYKGRADQRAADLAVATKAALENEALATQRANDVLSLSAQQDLDELVARADELWPAHPERIPEYEAWLKQARELIEGRAHDVLTGSKKRPSLDEHKAKLAEMRSQAKPPAAGASGVFEYGASEAHWWDVQLSKLVAGLEALSDPDLGLMNDTLAEPFGWGVQRRYEFAKRIQELSLDGPEASRRWTETQAAVRASAKYGGLELQPQLGLLPIGVDPVSGLFEFAHLQTGEPARRGSDGKLSLSETTGLVFVLIPGGRFWMGAQKTDPTGRNFDPNALPDESPVHEVELEAYFLSKYEMTQGQWLRIAASNPSTYGVATNFNSHQHDLTHPVEQVTWNDSIGLMARLGLTLPDEAQWERGCRADTQTPWWTGSDRESLRGRVNMADQTAKRAGAGWTDIEDWPDLEDGWVMHAPVGSFAANPFGLHEVHGNVWEWCRDSHAGYARVKQPDSVAGWSGPEGRVFRGGSFYDSATYTRSAYRYSYPPQSLRNILGLRPARAIK